MPRLHRHHARRCPQPALVAGCADVLPCLTARLNAQANPTMLLPLRVPALLSAILVAGLGLSACRSATLTAKPGSADTNGGDATAAADAPGSGSDSGPDGDPGPDTASTDALADTTTPDGDAAAPDTGPDAPGPDSATDSTSAGECDPLPCPASSVACMINTCQADHTCKPVAAQPGSACDDADKCTLNDKCASGQCKGDANSACECQTSADCAKFEDGNACNGTQFCDKSGEANKCKVDPKTVVTCPDSDPGDCLTYLCEKATGACKEAPVKDFTTCEGGNLCTKGATCSKGVCKPGANLCKCQGDEDCAKKDDDDLCNGSEYCDLSSGDPALIDCKVNPATVVKCSDAKDTVCSKNTCAPATGKCAQVPVFGALVLCDDGNACTTGDECKVGKCVAGTNTCTCSQNSDCLAKEDKDLCNGTLFCNITLNPPKCEINPATVVSCPSGTDTQCIRTLCNPLDGKCMTLPAELTFKKSGACNPATQKCDYLPLNANESPTVNTCDDGNACTTGEICAKGKCQPSAFECKCQADSDCKDDGDVCNGVPFCDKAAGSCKINPATVVTCPSADDTVCVTNKCDIKTGQCKMTPVSITSLSCDDGNTCTTGDVCSTKTGLCESGTNICTCNNNGDCASQPSNPCDGVLYCDLTVSPHACIPNPATVVKCSSAFDTDCETNTCDKTTGKCKMKLPLGFKLCEDGNPCTIGDVCASGACGSGTNTCVCEQDADCGKKEDGDVCNGTLFCDKTKNPFQCAVNAKTVVTCPSVADTVCSTNRCNKLTGVCAMVDASPFFECDDDNPCTKGDHCQGGSCAAGQNLCQCSSNQQCDAIDDTNLCNGKLYCDNKTGQCAINPGSVIKCEDTNPCTADFCDAGGKCVFATLSDGTACANGKMCMSGVCAP